MRMNEKGQMVAPATINMTANDFKENNGTSVYWLGGGGAMINSHSNSGHRYRTDPRRSCMAEII